MRVTIDQAGRLVVPKAMREQVGLDPGEVDVTVDGAGLHIEAVAGEDLIEEDGWLVIPPSGGSVSDETVRALRDAGER